jgi:hypothetical protein
VRTKKVLKLEVAAILVMPGAMTSEPHNSDMRSLREQNIVKTFVHIMANC